MKSTELLELVIRRVPYPDQVTGIDVTREPDALRFTWRGVRFRVEEGRTRIMVEEARNGCLAGSDIAILMEEILKREPARPEAPPAPAEPEDADPPVLYYMPNQRGLAGFSGWYVTMSKYVAAQAASNGDRVRRYVPAPDPSPRGPR